MYRASSVALIVKFMEEYRYSSLYVFPFRDDVGWMMLLYLVTRGWNFTIAYMRNQSINNNRHIERRHVTREEFRE